MMAVKQGHQGGVAGAGGTFWCMAVLLCLPVAGWAFGAACNPNYSPPLRMGLGRLPEALGAGGRAAQVSYGHPIFPVAEGRFTLALTRTLDLDLGLFWMLLGVPHLGTLMGSAALQWEALRRGPFRLRLTGGFGIGRGGQVDDAEGAPVRTSAAGGALVGVDFGFRINRYVGLYLGNRYQVSDTPETALTHWGYHVIGVHAEVKGFYFALESGVFYAANRAARDVGVGPSIAHVTFGYRWGPEAPATLRRGPASRPVQPSPMPASRPVQPSPDGSSSPLPVPRSSP